MRDNKDMDMLTEVLDLVSEKKTEGANLGAWGFIGSSLIKIAEMYERNQFTSDEKKAVDLGAVLRFLESETGGKEPIFEKLCHINNLCQTHGNVEMTLAEAEAILDQRDQMLS
jgi:hypothetical protein